MQTLRTTSTDFGRRLTDRADAIEARYRELTSASRRLFEEAQSVMPGGSTRDAVIRKPYPTYLANGYGSWLTDVDGRRIADFWFNATSLPLGHCDPRVTAAVQKQVSLGSAFFGPCAAEIELARELRSRLPSAERVRFTNSGSEAVALALRIARASTDRQVIAKFEGSYHGTYDDVLWSMSPALADAGPADRPSAVAASAGLPAATDRTLVLPFNNLTGTANILRAHGGSLACVIVEPVANRMGLQPPRRGFLEGLRALCDELGALLVFDEVIAFRVAFDGAQGMLGVTPDLTALGKMIGGGFPVGAVAGRADVMAVSEPQRPHRVVHYGTFSANPVTMEAGKATLDAWTPEAILEVNTEADRLRKALRAICADTPLQVTGVGSFFKITATTENLLNHRSMLTADRRWHEVMSLALLTEGFLVTTDLQGCLSTATTPSQIDAFASTFERLLAHA